KKKTIEKEHEILEHARKLIKTEIQKEERRPKADIKKLSPGDTVYIASLKKNGTVESISEKRVKLQVGLLKIETEPDDLFLTQKEKDDDKHLKGFHRSLDFDYSLDIRGMRVEDALNLVERNIEAAYVNGQTECEIIHGKGTGALKKAIRDYLKELPFVKSLSYAKPEEGGQGKTIIKMK
ncbi:MAG: hypothetical protein D6707_13070, partial [Bacteroidetes bacterium]